MGLRERKLEQTRQRIVDAAYDLFGEHGFTDTTVEMIAEEAFVSSRTIYRHFSAKDAIVFAELDGQIELLSRKVREHCAGGVSMHHLIEAFAEQFGERQHEPRFPILTSLVRENPDLAGQAETWRRELVAQLASDIAELRGAASPDLGDRTMAATAVTIAAVSLTWWVGASPRPDLRGVVRGAGRVLGDNWETPNR